MRPLLLSAAMAVAAAGCSPSGFARFGPLELVVFGNSESRASLSFQYDSAKQGCQTLAPDFSAEMNGAGPITVFPGEEIPAGVSYRGGCSVPVAMLPRPAVFGQTATITATSGEDTVLVEVEYLGERLEARPILAPGEAVHVGQLLRLAVEPGWDRVRWGTMATILVPRPGTSDWDAFVPIAPPSAGVLEVPLPSTMPSGPAHIEVLLTAQPAITRCEGAGACSAQVVAVKFDPAVDTVP